MTPLPGSQPNSPALASINWFDYAVRVQPHHTDYGGVVWHGTYVTWLESARVECLRTVGVPFENWVALGYDLPVVELEIRYRYPLMLGASAVVKTRLAPISGIRLSWLYQIETVEPSPRICLNAKVSLVTVDMTSRKIVRQVPHEIHDMVRQVESHFAP